MILRATLIALVVHVAASPIFDYLPESWGDPGSRFDIFIFHFVRAGLVEETLKCIPCVILLAMRKERLAPSELIVSAALSGLMFGAIECVYYSQIELLSALPRTATSVFLHISLTALVAYSWISLKRQLAPELITRMLLVLVAVALLHGAWNWSVATGVHIVGFAILASLAIQFSIAFSNLAGTIDRTASLVEVEPLRLDALLFYGMIGLYAVTFVLTVFVWPLERSFFGMLLSGIVILFFYPFAKQIGNITPSKDEWQGGWIAAFKGAIPRPIDLGTRRLLPAVLIAGGVAYAFVWWVREQYGPYYLPFGL